MTSRTRDLETISHDDVEGSAFALIGRRIERFEIRRVIGSGGMGVVLEAHDPALDRRVALKLVRGTRATSNAGQRLVREARAMARLAHPNVVTVYEVGAVEDRVFVAMELVAGRTLATWLEDEPRRAQILATFTAAGTGLAAAHDAGVVHRDFKPSNVLVGDDGRVRVTDFGIALLGSDPRDEAGTDAGARPSLTRTGRAMGTPRYMAPEQHAGSEVTPQADQYAFCVALWEALYGEHPFASTATVDSATSVVATTTSSTATTGAAITPAITPDAARTPFEPPRPPRTRDVPVRVVDALRRGLARDPADRWPSMTALLAALAPRRRRWVWAAVLGATAAAAIALAILERAPESCKVVARERGDLAWSAPRRVRIFAGLIATGHPAAAPLVSRALREVDRVTARWALAFADGCTSARVGGAAAAASERRLACLDRQLDMLDGTLTVLERAPSPDLVHRAEAMIGAVPAPDDCVVEHEGEAAPPPVIAAEVARLTQRLAEVNANLEAGRLSTAESLLTPLVPQVAATGWGPLEVRTDLARARIARSRGTGALDLVLGAARKATALRMEVVAATAWAQAVQIAGDARSTAEVDMLATIARAQAERTGAPHAIADAAIAEGRAYASLGKPAQAERTCRAVLAAHTDPGDPRTEAARTSASECLLDALTSLQNWREVERIAGELIARWQVDRPAMHPVMASYLAARATALSELGRTDEAMRLAEQEVAIQRAVFGPAHPNAVEALRDLAGVFGARGQADRAEALLREAIALIEPAVAAGAYAELERDRRPATVLGGLERELGNLAAVRDDLVAARTHMTRAAELARKSAGDRSLPYAVALMASSQFYGADVDGAIEANRRAREIFIEQGDTGRTSFATGILGKLHADAKRWAEARPLLEEVTRAPSANTPARTRGVMWMYLAQACLKLGDRPAAVRAAHAAVAAYVEGGDGSARALAKLQKWMAEHGLPPVPR